MASKMKAAEKRQDQGKTPFEKTIPEISCISIFSTSKISE